VKQITVRDVPDDVVEALRECARDGGQSLNSIARTALAEYAARRRWRRRLAEQLPAMDALRERIAARRGGELPESVPLIASDRERRRSEP